MDLEQFEADARAAHATGRYKLTTGQFGTRPDLCCLLMMVILHLGLGPLNGNALHTDLVSRRYGGDNGAWWSLLCGYDGVGTAETAQHPAAWKAGRRLGEEFGVDPSKRKGAAK